MDEPSGAAHIARQLSREWRHDRLQTTAVVNEACLKLFGQREVDWQNRGHFFAIAAQLMRRILVDHARQHLRYKRGGGELPLELDEALPAPDAPSMPSTRSISICSAAL